MSIRSKFLWGSLAGVVIVLVKILGQDRVFVRSLFEGETLGGIGFYIFISLITIFLGAISGLFSQEKEPVKLLIFCASVPALLTTVTTEQRGPAINSAPPKVQADQASIDQLFLLNFIAPAYAQAKNKKNVCNETGFFKNFTQTGVQYLTGTKTSELPYFAVVVASTKDFEEAKSIADKIYQKDKSFAPFVGCKRPGNDYYPVIIGEIGEQVSSAQWVGRFEEANILSQTPYLSFYEHRAPVYVPR